MEKLFITGGTGYIGSVVVKTALEKGYHVQVLTRSPINAKALKDMGVEAIVGDLTSEGKWQDIAERADYMIHVAAPPTWEKSRVSRKIAMTYQNGLYDMTQRLLKVASNNSQLRKLIYVAGSSYFGDTGMSEKANEDMKPVPKGWGPCLAPSVDLLSDYIDKGVPVVTAFPGAVYGPDSWFVQLFLDPLLEGKKLTGLKGYDPYMAPIHVHDCARALHFLLEKGSTGERYLLVDDEPLHISEIRELSEKELKVSGRTRLVPSWLCNIIIGPVLTDYSTSHNYFTNQKLRQLGFDYLYPTMTDGISNVIESWLKQKVND